MHQRSKHVTAPLVNVLLCTCRGLACALRGWLTGQPGALMTRHKHDHAGQGGWKGFTMLIEGQYPRFCAIKCTDMYVQTTYNARRHL